MEDFKKIAIKKNDKEETDEARKEKVLDSLWSPEEKRTVLGLLKGRKMKKKLKDSCDQNQNIH